MAIWTHPLNPRNSTNSVTPSEIRVLLDCGSADGGTFGTFETRLCQRKVIEQNKNEKALTLLERSFSGLRRLP